MAWLGFLAALLFSMVWTFGHAYLVDAVLVRLCDTSDAGLPAEKRPPYALLPMAFDGYVWVRHAYHLTRDGQLRLRFTDFDNAPDGRPVHWNSAFAWWLRGLGEIYRAQTGQPLYLSISRMAIWANPILLGVALVLMGSLAAKRYGPLSGAVVVIGMVTTPTFYEGFMPGYPDHHGLIGWALLGLVFGLAWAGGGWVQPPDASGFVAPRNLRQARIGIWISAISGAAGLWVSALSTSMVLGALGAAVLASTAIFARSAREAGCSFHPWLIKQWAIIGAAGSLVFYALEYFPWHIGLTVETNHPVYALAWLGGGWILATLGEWLATSPEKRRPLPWLQLIIAALACVPLPALVFFGGPEIYIPRDPFMQGLWKNIRELLPLLVRMEVDSLSWQAAFGFYPALLLLGFGLLASNRLQGGTKTVILLLCVTIVAMTGLQFYQSRWGMLAGPLYIALAAVVVPVFWRLVRGHGWSSRAAAALIAGFGLLVAYPSFNGWIRPAMIQYEAKENTPIDPIQGLHLLHREVAKILRAQAGDRPIVLLSSPNSSCLLGAFADCKTIGTLYWENVDGLKKAARALNAQNDTEALQLLKELGVTHVFLLTWENFIEPYFYILYPSPVPGKRPQDSFGIRALFKNELPLWARPLPIPPLPLARMLEQKLLVLEIVPDQTLPEACIHVSRYLRISLGDAAGAENFARQALQHDPDNPEARTQLIAALLTAQRPLEAERELRLLTENATASHLLPAIQELTPLLYQNQAFDAAAHLFRAAARHPEAPAELLIESAWLLSTLPRESLRDPALAAEALTRAEALGTSDRMALLGARAALAALEGNFPQAQNYAQEGLTLAQTHNNPANAARFQAMLELYNNNRLFTP